MESSDAPTMADRAATENDIPAIAKAWQAMRVDAELPDTELIPDWSANLHAFLAEHISRGSAIVWLREHEDDLAGTAMALLKDDYPYCLFGPGVYGFIGCVYTAPSYRRRGIATALVCRSIDWLRARGVSRVRLLPTSGSLSIYKRLGFRNAEDLDLML